ncbi:MAG: hypothetical protein Q7S72_00800 [Candidatus Taylorbacteria bacterium]|nr:hypothetical protein [Candidatus Taylorbacteria bacterium]
MNPEERSLLERTYKMVEENNAILRTIRRGNRIGMAFKAFYWIIIIGLSIGAFYVIQPYYEFMTKALGFGDKAQTSESTSSNYIQNLQELLK